MSNFMFWYVLVCNSVLYIEENGKASSCIYKNPGKYNTHCTKSQTQKS